MMKRNIKTMVLLLLCCLGLCGVSQKVFAEDYSYVTKESPMLYNIPVLDVEGKTTLNWTSPVYSSEDNVSVVHEVQLATDDAFTNPQTYSATSQNLVLDKAVFGANGGKFYCRVRTLVTVQGDTPVSLNSMWSETQELVYVAINKTNFPGMYKVLKNGSQYSSSDGLKDLTFDKNGDGWLDPQDINELTMFNTVNKSKKVNGVYKVVKGPNVSSFKGVEYLTNLTSVNLCRYSGKTADLSKCTKLYHVFITGISAKQFSINAPQAESIHVEADSSCKMTKMDVSKCNSAVDISAYGNKGTKTLKLPKEKKKLKVLSLSDYKIKSINLNSYTNLQQVYFYEFDTKKINVNKCKNLRYIYFFFCDDIKSLNLKSNTKLRGADFYKTPGLTKSTVKRPKNGKYTWNKGKWWYGTSAYKKDMKKLY